jgi:heme exporter protein D
MSHAFYVASAFGVSALVIAILVGWIVFDLRRVRRQIEELERHGLTRGSGRTGGNAS